MIKRFHALYVGQIELDNIGLGGTPANEGEVGMVIIRLTVSVKQGIGHAGTQTLTTVVDLRNR